MEPIVVNKLGWRDESYPFTYIVYISKQSKCCLEVVEGPLTPWLLKEFSMGEAISWKSELPKGLYIISGIFRIKDQPGCCDWNSEWVEQITYKELSSMDLLNLKRGTYEIPVYRS